MARHGSAAARMRWTSCARSSARRSARSSPAAARASKAKGSARQGPVGAKPPSSYQGKKGEVSPRWSSHVSAPATQVTGTSTQAGRVCSSTWSSGPRRARPSHWRESPRSTRRQALPRPCGACRIGQARARSCGRSRTTQRCAAGSRSRSISKPEPRPIGCSPPPVSRRRSVLGEWFMRARPLTIVGRGGSTGNPERGIAGRLWRRHAWCGRDESGAGSRRGRSSGPACCRALARAPGSPPPSVRPGFFGQRVLQSASGRGGSGG